MIVFDLDGTLADDRHRRHLIKGTKRGTKKDAEQWAKYNSLCLKDPPIKSVALLLNLLRWNARCEIWSARCESTRADTIAWLSRHVFINGPGSASWNDPNSLAHVRLRLRPVDDHRPSIEVKTAWIEAHKGPPIDLVFEDHVVIAAAWRARGIRVALLDTEDYTG